MKQKLFFAGLVLLMQLVVTAQSKYKFTSINQAGLAGGQSVPTWLLQTINGISYKTYSAAIGVGIDNYYIKTVPIFLDIRKTFGKRKSQPFAYVDAGADCPWKKADAVYDGIYHTGFYMDAGIGYSIKVKKNAIDLSFGYTEKNINEDTKYYPDTGFLPYPYTPETNNVYYKYKLSRVTMKIGLRF